MSVNKINCNSGRLTLHGDYVVYHQDGVEFSLDGDAIPGFLKGSRKGNVFISTHKVIFAPTVAGHYGSFSMNFQSIRNVEVKQPMFGANFVKGDVISEPDGGWQGRGTFKVVFNSGGAIEFAERFRHCVVSGQRPGVQPPPPSAAQPFIMNSGGYYTPHHPFVSPQPGHYAPSPQGYYSAPPGGGSYATPPQGYYPVPPPGGYPGYPPPVGFMTQPPPYQPPENPPPYPGQAFPSAPPSEAYFSGHTGDVKAREAYVSGQNVYVPAPQPPPPYAPPPYNPADKKNV